MTFLFEDRDDAEFDLGFGGIDYGAIAQQGGSDDEADQFRTCARHGLRIDADGSDGLPDCLGCDMCLREFVAGVIA